MLGDDSQKAELVDLFHSGHKLEYRKGEFVIRPGETPSGVFFIEEGLVKSYDITKYGEENLLVIRKKDEIFPLIWAIIGQERHIIYQTLSPTVLWHISREQLLEFMQAHTGAALVMLDSVVEMYRLHSERILNLEYRSVRERLVSFLVTMSQRFGKQVDGGILLDVPLRHQDIASSINASRETTSREMAYLERKGLVINHQLFITLKDVEKLREFL
jgi:CRP/FNR family cyclic AMP-dependent transcriptional regulator